MSYDAQRALAIRLITAKGTPATITQVAISSVNVSTDAPVTVTLTMGVVAVVLPASGTQADTFESRTKIRTKYRLVYFTTPTLPFVPQVGDTINWGEGERALTGVSPLAPDGDQPILFTAVAEVA